MDRPFVVLTALLEEAEAIRSVFRSRPVQTTPMSFGKYRPELSRLLARSDPHSPPALRVNLPLRNLPQFQAAFSCPATARMVRPQADRCEVW
jgi:hypothetical protein